MILEWIEVPPVALWKNYLAGFDSQMFLLSDCVIVKLMDCILGWVIQYNFHNQNYHRFGYLSHPLIDGR